AVIAVTSNYSQLVAVGWERERPVGETRSILCVCAAFSGNFSRLHIALNAACHRQHHLCHLTLSLSPSLRVCSLQASEHHFSQRFPAFQRLQSLTDDWGHVCVFHHTTIQSEGEVQTASHS